MQIVVLNFTHNVLVYILVLFFYTLHGGVIKSVNLAVLAEVILCCVHGGVAGKHRSKCVKNRRTRTTQDICDGLCLSRTVDCAVKIEERFCYFPLSPKQSVCFENSWDISQ